MPKYNYKKTIVNNPSILRAMQNSLEMKFPKKNVSKYLFNLLIHNDDVQSQEYEELKREYPDLTDSELADGIGKIIELSQIDVNRPCYHSQDLMYHAMKYGSVEDVKMLIEHGYNKDNTIDGQTIMFLFENSPEIKEYDEKMAVLKENEFESKRKTVPNDHFEKDDAKMVKENEYAVVDFDNYEDYKKCVGTIPDFFHKILDLYTFVNIVKFMVKVRDHKVLKGDIEKTIMLLKETKGNMKSIKKTIGENEEEDNPNR